MINVMKVIINGRVEEREIAGYENNRPVPVVYDNEKVLFTGDSVPKIIKVMNHE